jgi:YesN/AraC family two-component response regulator
MSEPIRVLIVDDHTVVRDGLKALFSVEPGIRVVGSAADGVEGVKLAGELEPDLILLDLVMPKMDGVQAINE